MPLTYGYVTARLLVAQGDGTDAGTLPDLVGAVAAKPRFTPTVTIVQRNDPDTALVSKSPIECTIGTDGQMLDPQGTAGVWLITGQYKVALGLNFPTLTIDVTTEHTAETPLDLGSALNYTPPPGVTVQTVAVPGGAVDGQVLSWAGGLAWVTPAEGGGGTGTEGPAGADGADGASAYELAVADGFVGTVSQWLASLVGPQGDPGAPGANGSDGAPGADGADGASAYEVAVANGFVGTEAAWLESLAGADGAPGADGSDGAPGTPGTDGADGTPVDYSRVPQVSFFDGTTRTWSAVDPGAAVVLRFAQHVTDFNEATEAPTPVTAYDLLFVDNGA